MSTLENYGFEQSVSFLKNYEGKTYVQPDKAGDDKELMLSILDEGRHTRQKFIKFAKIISDEFHDLKYVHCSQWKRNNGRGQPTVVKDDIWIQLKNPKWQDQPQSVSLSFGPHDCLDVRIDIHQDDKRLKEDPEFNRIILEQQFRLLDIPVNEKLEFRIREEGYKSYGNESIESIKAKYKNTENKPLIQVGTTIESISEKDNEGILLGEVLTAVRVVKTYYDYVMTLDSTNCKDLAESIDNEMEELQLKGEVKEAVVKLRVNQNAFRNLLLNKFEHCALCKVNQPELLVASHIKPWRNSSPEEKLDRDNGFLMCPNHDLLFDRGLISFDDDGNILISSKLTKESRDSLGIKDDLKIQLSERNKEYLQYHRENIFQK